MLKFGSHCFRTGGASLTCSNWELESLILANECTLNSGLFPAGAWLAPRKESLRPRQLAARHKEAVDSEQPCVHLSFLHVLYLFYCTL